MNRHGVTLPSRSDRFVRRALCARAGQYAGTVRFLNDLQPTHDLTYNDVFMVPGRSDVTSRFDVDLTTADGIGTTLPLVVANMTAVSGRRMAETRRPPRRHRDHPAGHPARHRRPRPSARVKAAHPVYDTPVVRHPRHDGRRGAEPRSPSAPTAAVVVVERRARSLGVVTEHDGAEIDRFAQVREVMMTDVSRSRPATTPATVLQRSCPSTTCRSRPSSTAARWSASLTRKGALRSTIYTPATRSRGTARRSAPRSASTATCSGKAEALLAMGVDVLVVDTAHGHQAKMLDALPLVVAARDAHEAPHRTPRSRSRPATSCRPTACATSSPPAPTSSRSASGPGAMCTTRMMTGVGRPQFSAVLECADAAARARRARVGRRRRALAARRRAGALAAGAGA